MLTLPKGIIHVLRHFEAVFSERVWEWAKVLLIGAILAPGERSHSYITSGTITLFILKMHCYDM